MSGGTKSGSIGRKSAPKHLHMRVPADCTYVSSGLSLSMSIVLSCRKYSMKSWASFWNVSRPTDMAMREIHSSALPQSRR